LRPQTPRPGSAEGRRVAPPPLFRPLGRRSSRIPAGLYPPPRYFQGGLNQPRRAMIFHRTAITPLTSCLNPGVHFSEPPFLPLPCRLPHTLQPLGHAYPALCRGRVRLMSVLLDQRPSLPRLRQRFPVFVQ